jgi:hypothetical protein
MGYDGLSNANSAYPMPAGPTPVPGLSGVVAMDMAETMACAILDTGETRCWGKGASAGPSIPSSPVPTAIPGLTNALAMNHNCVLRASGDVVCWKASEGTSDWLQPATADTIRDAADIAVADSHVCVLSNGKVQCWGSDFDGQLGRSLTDKRSSQELVDVCNIDNVQAVFAGPRDACALLVDGRLVCWGSNDDGQLGQEDADTFIEPVVVQGL